jgi:transposase-like protein
LTFEERSHEPEWEAAEALVGGVELRLVLKGREPGIDVAALCRQEGLSPTQYYDWKKHLAASGEAVFGKAQRPQENAVEAKLQAELTRMKNVIAEITAETLELKKRSRCRCRPP